jgi:RimJ/RimL family protein N-acetyltransferase
MRGGVIRTERLILRPLTPADTATIAAALADWDVARWLTRVPYPYGPAEAQAFIAANRDRSDVWAIADSTGLVGIVGMQRAFGYWLARPAWGRGYATEVGRAVLARHFAETPAAPVLSGHLIGNQRSAHVLGKLGFRITGHAIVTTARGDDVLLRRMMLTRPV